MSSYIPAVFLPLLNRVKCIQGFFEGKHFGCALFFLSFLLASVDVQAQTDFAPGDIMFTGYDSDDADRFSFVLLADVGAGTIIYITDRGWENVAGDGFRDDNNGEGTISFVFTVAATCGTEYYFIDVNGTNDWEARNAAGALVGTVAILTSTTESPSQDADGIELGCSGFGCPEGDQLFIYQSPEPSFADQSSFVTAIHMNGNNWNGNNNTDSDSQKPPALADGEVVRFGNEYDNAKYDCNPREGSASVLRAAITNYNGSGGNVADGSNNWIESDNEIQIQVSCPFCCGDAPNAPMLSAPTQQLTSTTFTINITGTLAPGASWELYTAGCGVGSPLQTTMSNSFTVTGPGSQQSVTYYVRSSEALDCAGFCGTVTVCFVTDLYARCTNCSANFTDCGNCFLPDPYPNPVLDIGCYAIKIIFVLDESGSIGSDEPDVKAGVLAFLNALNGQDAEVALIEFSDEARVVNNYTTLNSIYINNITNYFDNIPFNGHTYIPGGSTNWHDAMLEVDLITPSADIVMFFTDGEPTAWTMSNGNFDYCGNGGTTQTPEIVNPVKLSNKIKSEGTHMFMLGVGNVDELNIQLMSGFVEYMNGVNTLGTSDYSIGNFEDLADDLEAFVLELCRTTIQITKETVGPVCDGVLQFRFIVTNTGTESATTPVYVSDTFPSGYTNIEYNGTGDPKLCPMLDPCDPPIPPNAFLWVTDPIPPGQSDTLILDATVLSSGDYVNTAWATTDNADPVSDTWSGPIVYDQPPTITCPANVTIQCTASTLPANTGTPTATNPEGPPVPVLTYVDVTVGGSCPQEYTITRRWTATDNCSNTAMCTQIIVVDDTTPPQITCPPNVTLTCNSNTSPDTLGYATATDCDPSVQISFTNSTVPGICALEFVVYRTWTALDDCGNTSTCLQVVTIDDSTPPDIICKPDKVINCTESTLPTAEDIPKAFNNCGDTITDFSYTDEVIIQSMDPECSIRRTWQVVDDCGNTNTCIQIITVVDNVAPVITCPANITIACSASTLPGNTGNPISTDNCDISLTIAYTDVITNSGMCIQEYVITRTWSSGDDCGNSSTCNQVITVKDIVPPVITCPNVTTPIECPAVPAFGNATATDNCDPSVTITFADVTVSGTCPQEYNVIRTWTATDDCGNSSSCSRTVVVNDNTPPVITCPTVVSPIECPATPTFGTATATDICDASVTITFADVTISGLCPQEYSVIRTWTAVDDCGNSSSCSRTVVVNDNTPPVITCPTVTSPIQCPSTPSFGTATATDLCDASVAITFADVTTPGSCPQEYSVTRTWTAIDDCGNSSTCSRTIVVEDNTAPVITCPTVTSPVSCPATPSFGTATATDACDVSVAITFSDVTTPGSCPQEYSVTRTWTAVDDCGNSSTCSRTIVVEDNTPPVITCPTVTTPIQCPATPVFGNASATDACDASVAISFSDATTPGTCPQEYSVTRTWTAVDDCGNSSTCSRTIVVEDNTAPIITCPTVTTPIQCPATPVFGTATATDACDASVAITFADITTPGSCPQEFSVTRTWTAVDDCGNSSSCSRTIVVEDNTAPVITCPTVISPINCPNTPSFGSATATDLCDDSVSISFVTDSVPGPCAQEYTLIRTWTAIDDCGNSSTCSRSIVVEDNAPPAITCPPNVTIECIDDNSPENTGNPEVLDACDTSLDVDFDDVTIAGPLENGYTIRRTWTVEDGCGNTNTCLQTIIVENPVDPENLGFFYDTICSGSSVVFQGVDQGLGTSTYSWLFGSGSSPSSANGIGPHTVTYTYNATNGSVGAFVSLTVNLPGCASVTDTVANINVNAIPGASIMGSTAPLCYFTQRTFKPVAAQMPGFTYQWNFGAGATPATASTYGPHNVSYSTTGAKTVTLIVSSNEAGASCMATGTLSFTVVSCPGNVTGKVQKPDGTPIVGCFVRLYADANADGVADNNVIVKSGVTNSSGAFSLVTVQYGHYVLIQTDLNGYFSLIDQDTSDDGDLVVNLNPNDNVIPVSMGVGEFDAHNIFTDVTNPGIITGYVFEDFDSDDTPESGEGIANVVISLYYDNNLDGLPDSSGLITKDTTIASGFYTFGGLSSGNYVLVEDQPPMFNSIRDFDPSEDMDNVSNSDELDDIIPVTLATTETDANNYFKEGGGCTHVVTNINDTDAGSFRFMVACANPGDTISFHSSLAGQVIQLTSDRIIINKNLFIHSDLSPRVSIKSNVTGELVIDTGHSVEFKNINFTSGLSGQPGAAFENKGHLTLWDVSVFRNPMLDPNNYLIYNTPGAMLTTKGIIQIELD